MPTPQVAVTIAVNRGLLTKHVLSGVPAKPHNHLNDGEIAVQVFHRWIRPSAILAFTGVTLLSGSEGLVSGADKNERFLKKWIAELTFAESGNRDWIVH